MRVLIVGTGSIARRHAGNLSRVERGVDIAMARGRPVDAAPAAPGGEPDFASVDAALDWAPDAAIVANAPSGHLTAAAPLLAAGVPVLVEKPIATTMDDARELVDAARVRGVPLMVGYNLRFSPSLRAFRDVVQAEVGTPWSLRATAGQHLSTWRPGADYRTGVTARAELGGGAVLELSHEIDYAMWLLGDVADVAARTAHVSDLDMDCEDVAEVLLRFSSGALGSIHLDTLDWRPTRYSRVIGDAGTAEWDMHRGEVLFTDVHGVTEVRFAATPDHDEMYRAELTAFLAAARGEHPPPVTGEDGIRALEVCLAARRVAGEAKDAQ